MIAQAGATFIVRGNKPEINIINTSIYEKEVLHPKIDLILNAPISTAADDKGVCALRGYLGLL